MKFQIGDRVMIKIPFEDAITRDGTVCFVSHRGRYPYLVRADDETGGVYKANELEPIQPEREKRD